MALAIREFGLGDRVALTGLLDAIMPEWVESLGGERRPLGDVNYRWEQG